MYRIHHEPVKGEGYISADFLEKMFKNFVDESWTIKHILLWTRHEKYNFTASRIKDDS